MRGRGWRIWKLSLILKKRIKSRRRYNYYPFYNKKLARKLVRKMNESMNNISQYNLQKIYKEYIHTIEYKRIIMNFPYYRKRMK